MDVSVCKPQTLCHFGQMSPGQTFKMEGEYYLVVGQTLEPNKAVLLSTGWLVELNHYAEVEPIELQAILKN